MTSNKLYKVTKRIKLHTKPLREALTVQEGIFIRETAANYIFNNFWARKSNVVKIEEIRSETQCPTL